MTLVVAPWDGRVTARIISERVVRQLAEQVKSMELQE